MEPSVYHYGPSSYIYHVYRKRVKGVGGARITAVTREAILNAFRRSVGFLSQTSKVNGESLNFNTVD